MKSLSIEIKQGNYLNKLETEVELEMRFIASDIMGAMDITSIFVSLLILIKHCYLKIP